MSGRWHGRGASPGKATGVAFVLRGDGGDEGQLAKVPNSPYVLVARMTSPDLVSFFFKALAVVTDIGGVTSHAATIARELGIPCVVATDSASQELRSGDIVEVNGDSGIVRLM